MVLDKVRQKDGGKGGIRTPEPKKWVAAFRVRCIRPLCHFSEN